MRKFLLIIFLIFNFPSFSQVGIQTSFEYGYFTSKNVDVKENLYHPYIGINYKNKISADFLIIPNLSYAPGFRDTFNPSYFSQNINLGFDLKSRTEVNEHNILSKCKWSPFENTSFNSKVVHTIVSGNHIYKDGQINGEPSGLRMEFNRD